MWHSRKLATLGVAVALTAGLVGLPASSASADTPTTPEVVVKVQSGYNQDITDDLMANVGQVTDPGICKIYPVDPQFSETTIDPTIGYLDLYHYNVTFYGNTTSVALSARFLFRTCDDAPSVRRMGEVDSLPTLAAELTQVVNAHGNCRIDVHNPNDGVLEFWFGDPNGYGPDGAIALQPDETKRIRVMRERLYYQSWLDLGELWYGPAAWAGDGYLTDIKVSRVCRLHPSTELPPPPTGMKARANYDARLTAWRQQQG